MKKYIYLLTVSFLVIFISCKEETLSPDTYPPTIVITSPIEGALLIEATKVILVTNDNIGVVAVEFYVDSHLVEKISKPPFEFIWNVGFWGDGQIHTLYAKGYDKAGNVGHSQVVKVQISSSAIAYPEIVEPTENQFILSNSVLLKWKTVTSAQYYQIETAKDNSFSQVVFSTTILDTALVLYNLDYSKYFWRIRAVGPNDNPSSWNLSSFTRVLPPPIAYGPINGQYIETSETTFNWSKVEGAGSYKILVSSDEQYGNVIVDINSTDTSITISSLPNALRLYWKVQTIAPDNTPCSWNESNFFSRFISFQKVFSGEEIKSIQQTNDLGFIVGTTTNIYKLDKLGNIGWSKAKNNNLISVREVSDGGFISAGTPTNGLILLTKWSVNGNIVWEKEYVNQEGYVASMDILKNGYIVCTGSIPTQFSLSGLMSRGWIVAFDSNGDSLWSNFSIEASNFPMVIGTNDGNIGVVGHSKYYRYGWGNISTLKMSPSGEIIWGPKLSGGVISNAYSISELGNGYLMVSYYAIQTPTIAVFDQSGNLIKEVKNVNASSNLSSVFHVQALPNWKWLYSSNGYLLKYDESDQVVWSKNFSSGPLLKSCMDGGIIVGGSNKFFKTDPNGNYINY